jgi:DNA-binding MarR family transcriptional regulator
MPAPVTETALETDLLEQVSGLRRALRRATSAPWPGGRLTGAQIELLRFVRREPGATVNEAAAALRVKPNTVSTLVAQLTEAGLVERVRDEHDRRVARLRLTGEAAAWLTSWRDERSAALAAAVESLGEDDRAALQAAVGPLARLVGAVSERSR